MSAGARNFERTFHVFLSFHFGEVEVELVFGACEFFAGVDARGFEEDFAVEEVHHFRQRDDAIDVKIVDDGGFRDIRFRNDYALHAEFAGHDCHRECSADRQDGPVERKFAHDDKSVGGSCRDFLGCGKHTHSDCQVVGCAFFFDIGGRHIDHNPTARRFEVGVFQGGHHPLVAFANGGVGKADDSVGNAALDGDFHRYKDGVNALNSRSEYLN